MRVEFHRKEIGRGGLAGNKAVRFYRGLIFLLAVLWLQAMTPAQTAQPSRATSQKSTGENDPARQEEARRWISRSIAAYGGENRLLAITDVSFSSHSTGPSGAPIQFKVYFKGGDKFRSEVTGSGEGAGIKFFAMTIANGPSAWLKTDESVIDLVAGDVESLKVSTLIQSQPYALFDRLTKFWALGDRTVDGVTYQMVGVSGFLANHYTRGEISLDPQSFLIRRFEYEEEVETKEGKGVRKNDLRYEGYQPFEGIMLPTRVVSQTGEAKSSTTFSDFKINSGVPDGYFDKPK